MLLRSNKLRLATVGIAALAILGGTTALAATHSANTGANAAAAAANPEGPNDEHQDSEKLSAAQQAKQKANAGTDNAGQDFVGQFQGQQ